MADVRFIVLLGVALRLGLFVLGRTPIDGDEAMIGFMGYHIATLRHFPLLIYAQHYMGTLEIPLLAAVMAMGPEGWMFSAWPLRFVALVYFAAFAGVHFKLCERFFGRPAARWMVFFLCVAPFYWMDFSSRLLHRVMMMFLGESAALLLLHLMSDWEERRTIRAWRAFVFGLVVGAAWWHFQLIVIYVAALASLVIGRPRWILDWVGPRNGADHAASTSGTLRAWDIAALIRILTMAAPVLLLTGLSLGWGSRWNFSYPLQIGLLLTLFTLCAAWTWRVYLRMRTAATERESSHPFARHPMLALCPLLILLGFLAGYSPMLIYLARLKEEFFLPAPNWTFSHFFTRLFNLASLDLSFMLELTEPGKRMGASIVSIRSYFNFGIIVFASYALIREIIHPIHPTRRSGAIFFLTLFAVLVILHVVASRGVLWTAPRHLVPTFATTSVALGLLADRIMGVTIFAAANRRRLMRYSLAILMALGSGWLWAPRWMAAEKHAMDRSVGHRRDVLDLSRALTDRDIQKTVIHISDPWKSLGFHNWVMFSYQIQFVSHMRVRCNRGGFGDRLQGRVDESRYQGREYLIRMRDAPPPSPRAFNPNPNLEIKPTPGLSFSIGPFQVDPLPEGYNLRGRNGG